jgi:uncharacterized protein (TIGR04255 family)
MTDAHSEHLPDFEKPPVVETVLSVQFEPLIQMRAVHLGLLWQEFRDKLPRTEERPPLEPLIERFPEPTRLRLGLQLQALDTPPIPRFWFLNEEGTELVQVQPDRFIRNWRKVGVGDLYPRYPMVKSAFEADFNRFLGFVAERKLGVVRLNQCEVTYVNHIIAGEGWTTYQDVDRIFTIWHQPADFPPGNAEDLTFHARFPIPGSNGKPIGRLHAELQPAVLTSDGRQMYVLNLTARGQIGESIDFFDLGREWIVKSFAALTTPDMHRIWRRRDNASNR